MPKERKEGREHSQVFIPSEVDLVPKRVSGGQQATASSVQANGNLELYHDGRLHAYQPEGAPFEDHLTRRDVIRLQEGGNYTQHVFRYRATASCQRQTIQIPI